MLTAQCSTSERASAIGFSYSLEDNRKWTLLRDLDKGMVVLIIKLERFGGLEIARRNNLLGYDVGKEGRRYDVKKQSTLFTIS